MKLCCYFNYAPLYRESVYRKIDETFDVQFYFGKDLGMGANTIEKIDYSLFKKSPIEFENKIILRKILWRTKLLGLAFKKYDTFILTGDLSYSYIPFVILGHILGKRIYGWGHGPKFLEQERNKKPLHYILNAIYKWFLKRLNGFFTYGEKGRNRMIELGFDGSKLYPIFNSLNTGTDAEKNKLLKSSVYQEHFNNDFPTILFIGRLTPVKKLDWLLKCLKYLEKDEVFCNLIIIGDGTEKEKLINLTSEFKLHNRVWFYGKCHDENILKSLLYNADVCVSPGDVGLTVIHAMTYGLPTISHDDFNTQMPEYETILNGRTGYLYKKDDFTDFCDKIKLWLTTYTSQREIVRLNCYDIINTKFNSNNQIEVLKKVLL